MLTQRSAIPLGNSRRWLLAALGLVLIGVVVLAVTAPVVPVPVFATLLVIPVVVALLGMPELAVPVAVFLLYINAPVVATRFHGVPSVINLIIPILLLIPLVHRVVLRREPLVVNAVLGLMLLYLAVSALSAVLSNDVATAFESVNGYVLEGLVIYFLVILKNQVCFKVFISSMPNINRFLYTITGNIFNIWISHQSVDPTKANKISLGMIKNF